MFNPDHICVIYRPSRLEYPSRNPISIRRPKGVSNKKRTTATKSQAVGLTPIGGYTLNDGVNWLPLEEYQYWLTTEKGKELEAATAIEVVEKRPLKGEETYNNSLADYVLGDVKKIIQNILDEEYLTRQIAQAPAFFPNPDSYNKVTRWCEQQLNKIKEESTRQATVTPFYQS